MRARLARALTAHGGRPLRHGIIAALVVVILAAGTGTSYAYWSAQATAGGTVKAAQLAVTVAGFESNQVAFANHQYSLTGSVTVTNSTATSSTTPAALSVRFDSEGGNAQLAAATTVTVWPTASLARCTRDEPVGPGAVSGAWAAGVTMTGAALSRNASQGYCVRSSISSREAVATPQGSVSFTPRVTASIAVQNFVGSGVARTTQSTNYIYAAGDVSRYVWQVVRVQGVTRCMDVNGGGASASGTAVIAWSTCHEEANQQWHFIPTGDGYVEIKPRNAPTLREDLAAGAGAGGSVVVNTANGAQSQQWQMQVMGNGRFQIVNRQSGLCLTAPTGDTTMTQVACDGRVLQQFGVTPPQQNPEIKLEGYSCSVTTNPRGIQLSWAVNNNGPYVTQLRTGGVWRTVGSATAETASGASIAIPDNTYTSSGSVPLQVLDSGGNVVTPPDRTITISGMWTGFPFLSSYVYRVTGCN